MKRILIIAISGTGGFLVGILAHSQLAGRPGTMGPETRQAGLPSSGRLGAESTAIRIEPIPSTGDSREADLVLQEQGGTRHRWQLGSIWQVHWPEVPINGITLGDAQAWWLSWPVGSGTGLSVYNGAVVWFPERSEPAFWHGVWRRTDSYLDDVGYEYEYSTELLIWAYDQGQPRLRVRVQGESKQDGKIFEVFSCVPRRMSDGRWLFVVEDLYRQEAVNRLLRVKCLGGVHGQLRSFLPAE